MNSFKNFWNNTKEAIFGKNKKEEAPNQWENNYVPTTKYPQKQQSQFLDEEAYFQYLQNAVQGRKVDLKQFEGPNGYTSQALQTLQEQVAALSFQKLSEIKQAFYALRRQSFNDLEQYARILKAEQQQQQLIVDITLQFLINQYKLNESLLFYSNYNVHDYVSRNYLQNQCSRILFCKEEIIEHLDLFQQPIDILYTQQFRSLSKQTKSAILTQLVYDQVQEFTKINESDEYRFINLFSNDPEVSAKYQKKNETLNQLCKQFGV